MAETFISYHNHSSYSFSDALISVEELVKLAKFHNSPAVAITEHGHAASMPLFFKTCEKEGIKPILGGEFYFMWDEKKSTEKSSYHLLITVMNEVGYKNFLQLTYKSNVPVDQGGGFYVRPRITEKMLLEHKEGLIISSSCVQGPVANLLLEDKDTEAYLVAEWFRDNFSHFHIEIMPHKLEIQVKVNKRLVEIGRRLGIPVITTLDTHLASTAYNEAYTCNGDLRRGKVASDRTTTDQMDCVTDWDLHYKSIPEVYEIFEDQGISRSVIRESLANTLEIDKLIDFTWKERYFESPKFCEDADRELQVMLAKGLIRLFGGKENIPDEYKARTRYEFDIIRRMGFSNYFLILHDAISFCESYTWFDGKKGIICGPGRGSAAGSLLAYILGITKTIDPIRYGLPFERFLNPDRTNTSPDIDMDVEPRGREILIQYLKDKWGPTCVIQVANHSEVKIKAALKDAGKWLMVPFQEMNAITASIPAKGYDENGDPTEMNFAEAVKLPEVQRWMGKHPKLFDIAEKLEGSFRQFGIHAGAVCILPRPAETMIPVMKKKNDTGADVMVSQWDKNGLESVGIHKYDFLGLSTLEILAECEKITGISPYSIPLDDYKTWNYFQNAKHMLGIFQFIEDKTKNVLRQIVPTNLNELADVNTLIRPGADLETYVKNKKAKVTKYKFDIPEVREELKNTYGAIIYQENIMNLAHTLAGFTLGEGDLVRRALEKNDHGKIAEYKKRFVENCKYPELAEDLFDWIGANANYLFNKSHALVYSLVGYWCAYYKSNYPHAFLVANLNHPKSNQKKSESEYIAEFIFEAREMGVDVILPVMGLCAPMTTVKRGVIVYGLSGIKGISATSAEVLSSVTGQDFKSYTDAALAVKREYFIRGKPSYRSIINKSHILNLAKIGFFGDPLEALAAYNEYFKESQDFGGDVDVVINDAVGFEWNSALLKWYTKIDPIYRNDDIYKLIEVKMVKKGVSKTGHEWTMIKGKTPEGEITGFVGVKKPLKVGEIIIASYSKSKGDAINIKDFKFVN